MTGKIIFQLFRNQFLKTIVTYLKISFDFEFRSMEFKSAIYEEWRYKDILKVIHVFLIHFYEIFQKGLKIFRDSLLIILCQSFNYILQSFETETPLFSVQVQLVSLTELSYSQILTECGSHSGSSGIGHKGLHSLIAVPLIL